MKKVILYTLLVFISTPLWSQTLSRIPKPFGRSHFEGGFTASTNGVSDLISTSALQYWSPGKLKRRFKFGFGVRLNASYGNEDLEYITARAKLTSGKTGPSVLFADQVIANLDTLSVSQTEIYAANLMLALRYDFTKKFGLEFNIDLAGISFGAKQNAVLTYDNRKIKQTNVYPTTGNVLKISDNDLGTLNSELMVSYLHKKRFRFKAGAIFLFNEYEIASAPVYVNNKGTYIDANRFRNKSLQFGIGANYVFNYYLKKHYK